MIIRQMLLAVVVSSSDVVHTSNIIVHWWNITNIGMQVRHVMLHNVNIAVNDPDMFTQVISLATHLLCHWIFFIRCPLTYNSWRSKYLFKNWKVNFVSCLSALFCLSYAVHFHPNSAKWNNTAKSSQSVMRDFSCLKVYCIYTIG